jgi:Tol biopolymer transport system component
MIAGRGAYKREDRLCLEFGTRPLEGRCSVQLARDKLRRLEHLGSKHILSDFAFVGPPDWSLDGSRIAFDAQTSSEGPGQIYVIDADGSNLVNLTHDSPLVKSAPSWSPDGVRIAFFGFTNGCAGLYLVDSNGSNFVRAAEIDADADPPSWSPDGTRIAFVRSLNNQDSQVRQEDIYTMNIDGSDQKRLTDSPGLDGGPAWSPDGSKIVFLSKRETPAALYT